MPFLLKARRILLPLDFSATSVRLLQWMTGIADKTGARLFLLHVVYPWTPPAGSAAPYHFDANAERIEAARGLLRCLLRKTSRRLDARTVHVVIGRPSEEIIRFARLAKPDLVVMASHGERGLKHPWLSATTERVARRAPCPVLAVPEAALSSLVKSGADAAPTTSRHILVPTDLSTNSATALRYAAAIGRELGSAVHVLNFFDPEPGRGFRTPAVETESGKMAVAFPAERLERWVRSNLDRPENVRPWVCPGKPSVYRLLRQAALLEADLIVLGLRGYSWAERLRLSNRTDAIVRNAPCPVMCLRNEPATAGS